MKRLLLLAVTVVAMTGCAAISDLRADKNEYDNPFYAKYLNTGSPLDTEISNTLSALRENPRSAELHNQLGALLVEKGFPNDAEREFERAVNVDGRYYPAWYNLGLVRAGNDDELGARRAFARTVSIKPGHAAALFQLGLVEEKRQHIDRAIALYSKAFAINPRLLDVRVNPRILDTQLVSSALLRSYAGNHSKRSMAFQGGPAATNNGPAVQPVAPSQQTAPQNIVPPAPPETDPAVQPAPPSGRNAEIVPIPPTPASTQPARPRRRPFTANPQNPPTEDEVPMPQPSTEPPPQPTPPPAR